MIIKENQVHDNDSDDIDDDYMTRIDYDAYLNLEAMYKYEIYDIAFENLIPQDQLKKIKEHMLANPSLMLGIYTDLDLKEKYHAFLRKELDILLKNPYTRKYCMQKFEKEEIQKQ